MAACRGRSVRSGALGVTKPLGWESYGVRWLLFEAGEHLFEALRGGVFLQSGEAGFFTDQAKLLQMLAQIALGRAITAGHDCEERVSV